MNIQLNLSLIIRNQMFSKLELIYKMRPCELRFINFNT